MKYALRKLIAFVFLGGIFWFVYFDVANIFNPRFQLIVGALVAVFGLFWLIVPWLVVEMRIFRRNAKNRRDYEAWLKNRELKSGGEGNATGYSRYSRSGRSGHSRLPLEAGENEKFHEKGTLYIMPGEGFDEISQPGKIGDVAFPREPRRWRKIQRVHFYLTDRRVFFVGKALDFRAELGKLASYRPTPGGIVFGIDGKKFAFTFQNPLIVKDLLGSAKVNE